MSLPGALNLKSALTADLLLAGAPYATKFRLAARAGFEGVELESVDDPYTVEEIREAALATGLKIHSVQTHANWRTPLSSPDRGVVAAGVRASKAALENAHRWGADTVLLIPGVVNRETSYVDAYRRSQEVIRRELLPMADDLEITLGIENVWNGFLLSPIEYVSYIDEFQSPWVRPYLDVGNIMLGHPEHWVRIVGNRIVKLHIKDFSLDTRRQQYYWGSVGKGSIDWPAVGSALHEVGFSGWATNSVPLGGLAQQIERVVAGLHKRRLPWGSRVTPAQAARQWIYMRSIKDIADRFDGFRSGRLAASKSC